MIEPIQLLDAILGPVRAATIQVEVVGVAVGCAVGAVHDSGAIPENAAERVMHN